ncbi:hypothetical protein BDN70DRAFT_936656 [Pholiota conissans]|uniref:Uncharacterized protein n=1 Tax=Pholiota conissans TaxID=109636 RepID=A0A9P5YTQ7_9AGAR|nr:hypothetical protein BDN70DRAFT_936656 [Pholiota conissans]
MGCFCSTAVDSSPGDRAYEEGDKTYQEYKRIDPSQRSNPEAQALLASATNSYTFAVNYFRKHKGEMLGTALVSLASLKWDLYRSATTQMGEKSSEKLEEIIKLDEEALTLWQARDPKPESYPSLLINLAGAYLERFPTRKECSDVQEALRLYRDACECTQKTSRSYIEATMQIGVTYWTWYCDPSNITTRTVDQIDNALRYLMDAHDLCRSAYPDIQCSCLYNLAWIYHHRFEKQRQIVPPNSSEDCLSQAIHFYQSTLQIMSQTDVRYAKALWFVPMLLFHRYERDKREHDLREAQKWARDAFSYTGITDAEQRLQLQAVRDFDERANAEKTRDVRVAVRRSTLVTFQSESSEHSIHSPFIPSILEDNGAGVITNEPQDM